DALVLLDDLAEDGADGGGEARLGRVRAGGPLETGRHEVEALGDDGVEDRVGPGAGHARADGAELELVAGEGEWAGAVAVARVAGQVRESAGAQVESAALERALGA